MRSSTPDVRLLSRNVRYVTPPRFTESIALEVACTASCGQQSMSIEPRMRAIRTRTESALVGRERVAGSRQQAVGAGHSRRTLFFGDKRFPIALELRAGLRSRPTLLFKLTSKPRPGEPICCASFTCRRPNASTPDFYSPEADFAEWVDFITNIHLYHSLSRACPCLAKFGTAATGCKPKAGRIRAEASARRF